MLERACMSRSVRIRMAGCESESACVLCEHENVLCLCVAWTWGLGVSVCLHTCVRMSARESVVGDGVSARASLTEYPCAFVNGILEGLIHSEHIY